MSRKGRGTGQGKRLVSFLVVLVLIAGFALTLVPPAHAADSYNMTVLQSSASSSSITTYTTGAYNTGAADTVFVLYSDCLGSNAPAITSVTDTLGDNWILAVSIGTPVTGGGSVPATTQEIWYAVGKSGSNAVTVTFASSCSAG